MKNWALVAVTALSLSLCFLSLLHAEKTKRRADLAHVERAGAEEKLFREAQDAQLAGDARRAYDLYVQLATDQPRNPVVRLQLGILLQDSLHDPIEAMHEFDSYLRLAPQSEKREMVEERRRVAKDQAVRIYGIGAPAAPVAGSSADNAAVEELRNRLAEVKANLSSAQAERDDYRKQAAQLQRQNDSLQKKIDMLQAGGTADLIAPNRNLTAFFETAPLPGTPSVETQPVSSIAPDARRTYRVKRGDTLVKIAQRAYGDATRNVDIRRANMDKIGPNDLIREGDVLVLP